MLSHLWSQRLSQGRSRSCPRSRERADYGESARLNPFANGPRALSAKCAQRLAWKICFPDIQAGWCLSTSCNFLRPWNTRPFTAATESPMTRAASFVDNSPSSRNSIAVRIPGVNLFIAADRIRIRSPCKKAPSGLRVNRGSPARAGFLHSLLNRRSIPRVRGDLYAGT